MSDPVQQQAREEADMDRSAGTDVPVGMSPEQIQALPVMFPFDPVVPAAFGISRSAAYRALKSGQLPITPFRLGRRLLVRRTDLLSALGLADSESILE